MNGPAPLNIPKKIIILLRKLISFSFSLEFMHTLESRPTSFFHSFEIRIIECEHNRNHMITSCAFFCSFWDFSVSISISDAILYGFSQNYVS